MACMEHFCHNCNNMWFTNTGGCKCPKCGSNEIVHTFDEEPEQEIEQEIDERGEQ